MAAASSAGTTPCSARSRAKRSRAVGCARMASYMRGCVNAGSSPSLWPQRRYPTRSMTKSLWNSARYSTASRAMAMHASGSSALTWTIGTSKPLARSLA